MAGDYFASSWIWHVFVSHLVWILALFCDYIWIVLVLSPAWLGDLTFLPNLLLSLTQSKLTIWINLGLFFTWWLSCEGLAFIRVIRSKVWRWDDINNLPHTYICSVDTLAKEWIVMSLVIVPNVDSISNDMFINGDAISVQISLRIGLDYRSHLIVRSWDIHCISLKALWRTTTLAILDYSTISIDLRRMACINVQYSTRIYVDIGASSQILGCERRHITMIALELWCCWNVSLKALGPSLSVLYFLFFEIMVVVSTMRRWWRWFRMCVPTHYYIS